MKGLPAAAVAAVLTALGAGAAVLAGDGGGVAAAGRDARAPVASSPGLVVAHEGRVYVGGRAITSGSQPAWNPDGTRIAFVRDGEVLTVAPDGSGERRVTAGGRGPGRPATWPAWSPDGTRIAFSDTRDLLTVRLRDGKVRRLVRSTKPWLGNVTPAYSPDGRRIAFARSTDAFNTDIFLVSADGTGLRRLTTSQGAGGTLGEEHAPAWTPDGRTIVFVSNRDPASWELWTIGVDGTKERRITSTRAAGYDETGPRVSRDGTRVLYTHNGRVATIRLDGGGRRELGRGTEADWR